MLNAHLSFPFYFDEVADVSYVNWCLTNMHSFGQFAISFLFTWTLSGLKFSGCFGKVASLLVCSVFELTRSVVSCLAKTPPFLYTYDVL